MRFIKHNAFIDICIYDVLKYIISSINLIVAIDNLIRFRVYNISQKKSTRKIIRKLDVQIKFNVCDSKSLELIKLYHFINLLVIAISDLK